VCLIRKIVKPAEATFPGKNGKIAYERNGGGKTEVTQGGEPSFSPDGKRIAYSSWDGLWLSLWGSCSA